MNPDPKSDPNIILREHTYDGIEEFDQKLPNWWLFTLYIMIVTFVVVWFAYYQMPLGLKSDAQKIDIKVAAIDQKRNELLEAVISSLTDESLLEMSRNPENVAAGKVVFQTKCLPCHGPDLTAKMGDVQLPGVNLVDAEWLHGGKPLEIMKTVTDGSPNIEKGMIAWKTQIAPTDIAQVVAYILSNQPQK